jgi:hypothetical protein
MSGRISSALMRRVCWPGVCLTMPMAPMIPRAFLSVGSRNVVINRKALAALGFHSPQEAVGRTLGGTGPSPSLA